MANLEKTDEFLVNRGGVTYKATLETLYDNIELPTTIDTPSILTPTEGAGMVSTPVGDEIVSVVKVGEENTLTLATDKNIAEFFVGDKVFQVGGDAAVTTGAIISSTVENYDGIDTSYRRSPNYQARAYGINIEDYLKDVDLAVLSGVELQGANGKDLDGKTPQEYEAIYGPGSASLGQCFSRGQISAGGFIGVGGPGVPSWPITGNCTYAYYSTNWSTAYTGIQVSASADHSECGGASLILQSEDFVNPNAGVGQIGCLTAESNIWNRDQRSLSIDNVWQSQIITGTPWVSSASSQFLPNYPTTGAGGGPSPGQFSNAWGWDYLGSGWGHTAIAGDTNYKITFSPYALNPSGRFEFSTGRDPYNFEPLPDVTWGQLGNVVPAPIAQCSGQIFIHGAFTNGTTAKVPVFGPYKRINLTVATSEGLADLVPYDVVFQSDYKAKGIVEQVDGNVVTIFNPEGTWSDDGTTQIVRSSVSAEGLLTETSIINNGTTNQAVMKVITGPGEGVWIENQGYIVIGPFSFSPDAATSTRPLITSSAFESFPLGSLTHTSTDWQITLNADTSFANVVEETTENTQFLTSWRPFVTLDPETSYRVRCKYHSNEYSSDWSAPTKFRTNNGLSSGGDLDQGNAGDSNLFYVERFERVVGAHVVKTFFGINPMNNPVEAKKRGIVPVGRFIQRKRQASEKFTILGYYPLYGSEEQANAASPSNTSHVHTFNGRSAYMPTGGIEGIDFFHGNYNGYQLPAPVTLTPPPTSATNSSSSSSSSGSNSSDSSSSSGGSSY